MAPAIPATSSVANPSAATAEGAVIRRAAAFDAIGKLDPRRLLSAIR